MQIGDLVYMSKSMLEMRYPEMGIIVGLNSTSLEWGHKYGIYSVKRGHVCLPILQA